MGEKALDTIASIMGQGIYSKDQLFDLIYRVHPDYSPNSCLWLIGEMTRTHRITNLGYGLFRTRNLETFLLKRNEKEEILCQEVTRQFPDVSFCLYPTSWIDEELKMPGGPDALIFEIEKSQVFSLYYSLHHDGRYSVMVDPKDRDLDLYYENESIIVKKLFSKSPLGKPGDLRLEKILVDLLTDRVLKHFYQGVDFSDLIIKLLKTYECNYSTLRNYAKRRNCEEMLLPLMKESLPDSLASLLNDNDRSFQL